MPSNFQTLVKVHLSHYRSETLGIPAMGHWKRNKREYPHLLPAEAYSQNILGPIREAFWKSKHSRVRLHNDFHHLNSSQALCFNLFFPLLSEDRLDLLTSALRLTENITSGQFEYVPLPDEKTSIDFKVELSSGARILFELKYTEQKFGSARDDEHHRTKFDSIYLEGLDARFADAFRERTAFLQHYQILRNIWHLRAGSDDQVFFVVPRANASLTRALPIIPQCVSPSYASRVRIVFMEDLLADLLALSRDSAQMQHIYSHFREKYLPVQFTGTSEAEGAAAFRPLNHFSK